MSHNIITANLWLGAPQILAQQVNCYLRTNFCKNLKLENSLDLNCTCISCQQINNKQHAQILFINPESGYTVETVKPILEQIVYSLDTNQKFFFVLPQVDQLSAVCANLLLKSLEEPPVGYHFILLAQRYYQVLPTIRSRCNITYLNDPASVKQLPPSAAPAQPVLQNSTEQELYEILTHQKACSQDYFLQLINKLNLSDLAQIALLDQIILYWSLLYKQSLYTQNNLTPVQNNLESSSKTNSTHLAQLVDLLNQQLLQPPVRGSAKIFWRNLFMQLNQILAP
jgi:DNA polymerase-3 subunit delta'